MKKLESTEERTVLFVRLPKTMMVHLEELLSDERRLRPLAVLSMTQMVKEILAREIVRKRGRQSA